MTARRSTAAAPQVPLDPDDTTEIDTGEFRLVDHAAITPSRLNPRDEATIDQVKLAELAATMKPPTGIIEPLVVRPITEHAEDDGAEFELIAGERRWRAAKLAGLLTEIPVLIKHLTDQQVIDVMMIENEQRDDINPIEKGHVYRQAIGFGKTPEDVAARIGRDVRYVRDRIRLDSDLIAEAQKLMLRGKLPLGHAIEISRLKPEQQREAINPNNYDAAFSPDNERLLDFQDPLAAEERRGKNGDPYHELKPRSLGELKTWINDHCLLQPQSAVIQDILPEAAEVYEQAEDVIRITYNHHVHPDAKDGDRIFSVRSWKRADGLFKSKTCERSKDAYVAVGPGRGQVFKACVDKRCTKHWPPARKRANGENSKAAERLRKQQEADRARQVAEERRRTEFVKAKPAILDAFEKALEKATLPQMIAVILAGAPGMAAGVKRFPGAAPDVRLRAYLFAGMSEAFSYAWHAERNAERVAKPFGLKLGPIVAKANKPAAAAKSSRTYKKKKR